MLSITGVFTDKIILGPDKTAYIESFARENTQTSDLFFSSSLEFSAVYPISGHPHRQMEGRYPITTLSTAALTAARGAMLPALAANAS